MGSPGGESSASGVDSVSASPLNSPTAPLSDAAALPTGTPRPGADYAPPVAPVAKDEVQHASVGPGTPRYETPAALSTETAVPAPGRERSDTPMQSPLAAQQAAIAADAAVASSAETAPTTTATAPSSPGTQAAAALDDIKLMADDDDWTAESELPATLNGFVDKHVESARAELTKSMHLEAAKWLLGQKLMPADEKKPELKAQLGAALSMRKEELAAGRPKPPDFGAELTEPERQECLSCWRQRMGSMLVQMRSPAFAKAAVEAAEPWVQAVLDAKREVIDPNELRLTQHLEGMWTDQVGVAKKELKGSRLRDVMKAHARTINATLKAAMDDVEQQFCEGMRPLVAAKLGTPAPLDATQLNTLITAGIRAFRVGFDRPWDVKKLEKDLSAGMQISQAEKDAIAAAEASSQVVPSPAIKSSSDIAADPVGYLLGLVLGSVELPLEAGVRDFVWSAVATYLDPFIDGEVPAAQYHVQSDGWFMARLRAMWASLHGDGMPCPVPASCALAAYASHAICKMNSQLGFGMHTPGLGRQPSSEHEAARLHAQVGTALVAAIVRDFEEPDRAFGSLPCLKPENIVHVSRVHLNGLIAYQSDLGAALAVANRDGEEARREERMRIWGYA